MPIRACTPVFYPDYHHKSLYWLNQKYTDLQGTGIQFLNQLSLIVRCGENGDINVFLLLKSLDIYFNKLS